MARDEGFALETSDLESADVEVQANLEVSLEVSLGVSLGVSLVTNLGVGVCLKAS